MKFVLFNRKVQMASTAIIDGTDAPFILLVLFASTAILNADTTGLIGEYHFDRVTDNQITDTSGYGRNGAVSGALPIQDGALTGLQFDGKNDYVDCGPSPNQAMQRHLTVECWVRPDAIPEVETGIVGTGIYGFMLTYYRDGMCWWYINGGTHSLKANLAPGVWQHVAGVYDGEEIRLYLNGKLVDRRGYAAKINQSGNLTIGAMPSHDGFYHGAVSQLRIYNTALREDQINQHYLAVAQRAKVQAREVTGGEQLDGPNYRVRLGSGGAIQVETGGDRYLVETAASYSGKNIGWNRLEAGDNSLALDIVKRQDSLSTEAIFQQYRISRTVLLQNHRVLVRDTITNTSNRDIGILYRNDLITADLFKEQYLGGAPQVTGQHMTAPNPSVFIKQTDSGIAWLAEDDVYRLQLELVSQGNSATMSANHFALRPGASHTFVWSLYPVPGTADYWDFVNQARNDWGVNTTVSGPFDFFDLTQSRDWMDNPQRFREDLKRKRLNIIAVMPWLDYDNHNTQTGRAMSREEFKKEQQRFRDVVKSIDPGIMVVGCMEGNLVSLPDSLVKEIHRLAPNKAQNQYIFTPEQLDALSQYQIQWKDCLLMNKAGRYRYELYYRGSNPKVPYASIAVFAEPGNDQHAYWLDQAQFMIEAVGLDGIYIDQFSMAFDNAQRYSHHAWDGTTVDIDATTGQITHRYSDAALIGIESRRALADYVTDNGKIMVANTFPVTARMQNAGVLRFNESLWFFDPATMADGEEPTASYYPAKGHLSTPIGLGFRPDLDSTPDQYTRTVLKGVICYLRNGLLYYHYGTRVPDVGEDQGGYGPINNMFPFTPVELHSGWLVGKERTISCVSGSMPYLGTERPTVSVFDLNGRAVKNSSDINREGDKWIVDLILNDWSEVAIIE